MAVTDLTGYTWTCSSILCGAGTGIFNINYTYNGEEWSEHPQSQQLCIGYKKTNEQGFPLPVAEANSVYMFDMQPTIGYVSIGDYLTFTGGTDVTNTSLISWLEENGTLTPPEPEGYEVTFVTNGGTSVIDLTEQTALPNPLPTTTKANHVFAGWYYDNLFTQKANAGATIESNVTLYAKWYTPTTWCEDIADAIREKEGSSEPIKHVDFADRIEALPSPKEEETKTVTPDFSSGNIVVSPTTDKVMTQVTVNKDTTNHTPENIKDGITLYGVAGTYEGGGGSSNVTTWKFAEGYGLASGLLVYIGENNEPQVLELSGTQTVKSIGPVGIWNGSIAQITNFSEQLYINKSYSWEYLNSTDVANFVVMPKEGCTITLNSDD